MATRCGADEGSLVQGETSAVAIGLRESSGGRPFEGTVRDRSDFGSTEQTAPRRKKEPLGKSTISRGVPDCLEACRGAGRGIVSCSADAGSPRGLDRSRQSIQGIHPRTLPLPEKGPGNRWCCAVQRFPYFRFRHTAFHRIDVMGNAPSHPFATSSSGGAICERRTSQSALSPRAAGCPARGRSRE